MSNQSKIQIGTKLKFLLVFLIFTLVTSSFNSFWSSKKFVDQINDLGQVQIPGISNMGLTDMMHDGIRANVYRAILANKAKDPKELSEVKAEAAEYEANIRQYISELQKLNLTPETKKAIEPALVRVDEYIKAAQEIAGIALSEDEDYARSALPKFNEKFEALEKELGTLGDLIREDSKRSTENGAAIEKMAFYLNIAALGIGILLLIFFALVFRDQQNQLKTIIENLGVQSDRIGSTANKLSTSAQNLLESTTRQSSAFQRSASALEEICATANITETNSKRLEENAKISFETATNGNATIEQMLNAMSVINNSNAMIMNQIEESNVRIGEIVSVIAEIENKTKVINDIVFQTKLLSFNASVEAARAGEQGKGFAVVAEEVGNLAQMSGNASKEISDMLTSSIKTVETIVNESKTKVESLAHDGREKVEHGIETAHQCGSALEEIVRQATSIDRLISEITISIKEQAIGIMEVANAMGLLDQASNENTATSKENLASAQELQDQVRKMEEAIHVLTTMIASKASS